MEKALVGKNPWKVVLFIIIHLKQFFFVARNKSLKKGKLNRHLAI